MPIAHCALHALRAHSFIRREAQAGSGERVVIRPSRHTSGGHGAALDGTSSRDPSSSPPPSSSHDRRPSTPLLGHGVGLSSHSSAASRTGGDASGRTSAAASVDAGDGGGVQFSCSTPMLYASTPIHSAPSSAPPSRHESEAELESDGETAVHPGNSVASASARVESFSGKLLSFELSKLSSIGEAAARVAAQAGATAGSAVGAEHGPRLGADAAAQFLAQFGPGHAAVGSVALIDMDAIAGAGMPLELQSSTENGSGDYEGVEYCVTSAESAPLLADAERAISNALGGGAQRFVIDELLQRLRESAARFGAQLGARAGAVAGENCRGGGGGPMHGGGCVRGYRCGYESVSEVKGSIGRRHLVDPIGLCVKRGGVLCLALQVQLREVKWAA